MFSFAGDDLLMSMAKNAAMGGGSRSFSFFLAVSRAFSSDNVELTLTSPSGIDTFLSLNENRQAMKIILINLTRNRFSRLKCNFSIA